MKKSPMTTRKNEDRGAMRVLFMGTPDFAEAVLEKTAEKHEIALVVTQPDRVNGRGGSVTYSPVKEWALSHEVPVFQPEKIRDPEAVATLQGFSFDVGVVAAYGQILPPAVLDLPKFGCVNVHASLLPKYRGAAPIQWAVINGDEVSGVTTMQMGPGLDDGDILLKEEVKLAPDETGGSLFDRLAVVGGDLLVRTLDEMEKGTLTPVPQNEAEATHVGMIRKEMGAIDFSRPAVEIERLIRGLNPWPSAFTSYAGKPLKIWQAEVISVLPQGADPCPEDAPAGTCVRAGDDLYIRTGEGYLKILSLQAAGKKRMETGAFLRGHDIHTGDVFGETHEKA